MNTFEKAKEFIYKNARPLDFMRWRYHFENTDKEEVLAVLSNYQNEDGGFGHGLEEDSWNPNSSPIQTWAATEILHEISFTDKNHKIIKGILAYLDSGRDFEDFFWYNTIKSNNEYPHAPWWHAKNGDTSYNSYNPTACLAGFIIRFAERESDLYKLGSFIAKQVFDRIILGSEKSDMHTLFCYIRFFQYYEESGITNVFDIEILKEKLIQEVKNTITQETDKWETSYICKPSQFLNSKNSIFYKNNENISEYECEYIIKTQLDDGSWDIPWKWTDYPEQWAISKNWWKSNTIISNLLYLKGFGKLHK